MGLEQQLRAALVPISPRPQVRAAVMQRLAAGSGRRGSNRWVLGGVALAIAAAAAMLAMQMREPVASAVVVDPAPIAVISPNDIRETPEVPDMAATVAPSVPPDSNPQAVAPAIKPFTVHVMPLEGEVADAPRKAAVEAVYATFVDQLRSVPGATLMDLANNGSATPGSPDYRITLKASAVTASPASKGDFVMAMEARRLGPGGRQSGGFFTGMTGEIAPGCASPASLDLLARQTSCADPAGVAAGLLATLRKMVFPPDPQLQQSLQEQLSDQALDPGQRLRALEDLGLFGRSSGTREPRELAPALRDSAVIRAAVQLASTTPDPAARAKIWYTLRGSRDPELLRPLVAALRTDTDDDTRLQALATLEADFATDPQVRAAMETAAGRDSNPMVRALAGRALGAESSWTEYVLASLKDTARSPLERIEALFYAYGLPSSREYGSFSADDRILRALDDSAMRALAEVLPKAAAASQHYASASHTLVSQLAVLKHPAITEMLLEGLSAGSLWLDRALAFRSLQSSGDPRARAALEKIASEDADPKTRELARDAMKQPSVNSTVSGSTAPSQGPQPPRLGVVTDYVRPGPEVRAELVGKLVVSRMAPGFPGDRAGLKEGDVLLEIGGKAITSGPQLIEVLDALQKDVDVDVLISRDGQTMRLTARF